MSFNVLVIPEDFTKDEHILKPLVERILSDCGKKAFVQVCRNPNFQGVAAALSLDSLRSKLIPLYRWIDLFILFVDRDGLAGRKVKTEHIENTLSKELPNKKAFLAEVAWQEAEIFILAGHGLAPGQKWKEIRDDPNVKNTFFKELVRLRGTAKLPHDGRKKSMADSISNWRRIKSRCPEDVGALIERISDLS